MIHGIYTNPRILFHACFNFRTFHTIIFTNRAHARLCYGKFNLINCVFFSFIAQQISWWFYVICLRSNLLFSLLLWSMWCGNFIHCWWYAYRTLLHAAVGRVGGECGKQRPIIQISYHNLMLCTRQASADDRSNKLTNFVKNVKIVEFHYHIRIHYVKCIQISTNMPSIGLVIPEIICEMLEFWEKKHNLAQ